MKKKMVTVLLTAAMVTAMAAGCGSSSDSGSDKKESYREESYSWICYAGRYCLFVCQAMAGR